MPGRTARVVLALTLLAGASCSDDDTPPNDRYEQDSEPSPGCRHEAELETGVHTVDVEGVTRTYHLIVPDDLDDPAPLLVDLHGRGSNAVQQEAFSHLGVAGAARGFVVVTPESNRPDHSWALPALQADFADVSFVEALISTMEVELCTDPSRIYASGASNGAGLATNLMCALGGPLGGRVAGVAPVAGVNLIRPCDGAPAHRIIAFHGTADEVVPYAGGALPSPLSELFGEVEPVEQVISEWAGLFHCADSTEEQVAPDVVHRTHQDCDDGVTVELYTVDGGGHTWPGGTPVAILGNTTTSIRATDLILDAFSE